MFFIKVCIYFCWFALAATFGLMRYSALGCQVVERYSGRRSHNWARIVAICMMVAVELMHWRSMHGLMLRRNIGEDAIFFTLGLLATVSYGLHRVFCWLVDAAEAISYDRAESDAQYYASECARYCFRASDRITDLECPVIGLCPTCPCLESGYDIQDVDYTSDVFAAISRTVGAYQRQGKHLPKSFSVKVKKHRVVVKSNPYDELFDSNTRWDYDLTVDDYSWLYASSESSAVQPERPTAQSEKTATQSANPMQATAPAQAHPATTSDTIQVRLVRGKYGAFRLRMSGRELVCTIAHELSDGRFAKQEITFPRVAPRLLDDFLVSEYGRQLCDFVNTPCGNDFQLDALQQSLRS